MYWIYDDPHLFIGVWFCAVFVVVTRRGVLLARATVHSWIHRDMRANEAIDEAWRQQRTGIVPTGGTRLLGALLEVLDGFAPRTSGEELLHARTLRQANQVVDLRRSRLAKVTMGLPVVIWWGRPRVPCRTSS